MGFQENLREEMLFQDIKPKAIADKTGISVNTIRNYINGHKAIPSAENAVKIAQVLGVSVEYLVLGKDFARRPSPFQKLVSDFQQLCEADKKSVLALIAEMKKHKLKTKF